MRFGAGRCRYFSIAVLRRKNKEQQLLGKCRNLNRRQLTTGLAATPCHYYGYNKSLRLSPSTSICRLTDFAFNKQTYELMGEAEIRKLKRHSAPSNSNAIL